MASKKKPARDIKCKLQVFLIREVNTEVCLFVSWLGICKEEEISTPYSLEMCYMCKYCSDTSSTGSPAMLKTITVSYIFKLSEFKLLPCSTILFTYTIMHFVPHLIWYPNIFCLFSAVFEPFSDWMGFFFVLNLQWQCLLYPFILHPC